MSRFQRQPQLGKLTAVDARWLRGALSETFPDGIPHSPFAVLDRLAAHLEAVQAEGERDWLRWALLQEIYRALNRYSDAVNAGERACRLRPWDPRSTYALALSYVALTSGTAESEILMQSVGVLPSSRLGGTDAHAVERSLAQLDLTAEEAAVHALWLLQATLSLKLRRGDRQRVERSLARLTEQWPALKRPAEIPAYQRLARSVQGSLRGPLRSEGARLRSEAPALAASVSARFREGLHVLQTDGMGYLQRGRAAVSRLPVRHWKYGGVTALVVVLLVAALGAGIVMSSSHAPGRGGPTAASAAEDPTTELLVFDQEGKPISNPMTIYRDSPATIIIALVNHSDQVRRYELSIRIDDEEWPLGSAEVQPEVRWDAGFQVTLSEAPRKGIEVFAQDAGTLALARSARFTVSVREAPVAVRATPESTETPAPSATPEPTATPSPAVVGNTAGMPPEPHPIIVPRTPPASVPLSVPASPNTVSQATSAPNPAPTLPAVLPPSALGTVTPPATATPARSVVPPTALPATPVPATATSTPVPQATAAASASPTTGPSTITGATPTAAPPTAVAPAITPTTLAPAPTAVTPSAPPAVQSPTPIPPHLIER
jgi:tetratricopeptide (TPR) repeat protein